MSKEPEIISQNSSQSVIKVHEHQYGQKLLDLSFLDIDEATLEFKYVLQDGTLYGYGEKEVYQRFNIDKDSLSLQAVSAFIGRDLSFIYDRDGDTFRTEAYITQISFTYKSNGVEKEHDVEFREIVDDIDRSGSFAGNKYTIDIYGPKINQLKEENIKSILDNTEYAIKDLSTKMSWKGTMDFGINVNTDTSKPDGVVSSIAFQKGANSLGEKIHSATHEQKTGEDLNGISVDLGFNISIQDDYDPEDGELEIYNMIVWFDPNPNPNSFSNKPANDGSSGQEPGYEDYVDFLSVVYHELFHSMGIAFDGSSNDTNLTNEYTKNLLPADSDGNIYYSSERTESIIEGGVLIRDYMNVGGGDHFDLGDPVNGIVKTLDNIATSNIEWNSDDPDPASSKAPWRIYNIGNNKSVKLMDYINALEKALGKKAKINFLPLQKGDVPDTFANVSNLNKNFNYKPSTAVIDGISNFVKWYKDYYKK